MKVWLRLKLFFRGAAQKCTLLKETVWNWGPEYNWVQHRDYLC